MWHNESAAGGNRKSWCKWGTKMLSGLETWEAVAGIAAVGGPAIVAIWKKVISPMRKRRAEREAKIDEILRSTKPNGHGTVIEIVERIEADLRALREEQRHNNEALKLLLFASLDATQLAVWFSNERGECEYASELLADYMGCDVSDVLGNGWKSQIAEPYRDVVFHEWDDAIKDKRPFEFVYGYRRNPGRKFIGKTRVLRNRSGKIYGYIGTLTPITES